MKVAMRMNKTVNKYSKEIVIMAMLFCIGCNHKNMENEKNIFDKENHYIEGDFNQIEKKSILAISEIVEKYLPTYLDYEIIIKDNVNIIIEVGDNEFTDDEKIRIAKKMTNEGVYKFYIKQGK
jgi:hypothetical protein